jgi:hypothetical protein
VLDLFEAVTTERPVLIVLDNSQWLDELSDEFIAYVHRRSLDRRLYLLVTARSYASAARLTPRSVQVEITENVLALRPLNDESARTLVRQIAEIADRALSTADIETCVQKCGGNPYFLAELIKFQLVAGLDASAPVQLETFISFRASALSSRSRRLLEITAILGSAATLARIQRILRRSTVRLLDSLEELQLAGLLSLDEGVCACRHDVIREVILRRMSPIARRTLHLRAARLLHEEAQERKDHASLFECGRLLVASGDPVRGTRGALWLARRLLDVGAATRALALATEAASLATSDRTRHLAFELRARCLGVAGHWTDLADLVRTNGEMLDSCLRSKPHSELELLAVELRYRTTLSEDAGYDQLARCVEDADAPVSHRLRAALLGMGIAENTRDRSLAERLLAALQTVAADDGRSSALRGATQMIFHVGFGSPDAARVAVDNLVHQAQHEQFLPHRVRLLRYAVTCYARLSNAERTYSVGLDVLDRAEQLELRHAQFDCLVHMTCADLQCGSNERALTSFAKMKQVFREIRDPALGAAAALATVGAYAAISSGDLTLLADVDPGVRAKSLDSKLPRVREGLLCYELLDAVRKKRTGSTRKAMEALLRCYAQTRGTGAQDFVVAILAHSLVWAGERERAADIVSDYLTKARPEKTELAVCVERLASTLCVAGDAIVRVESDSSVASSPSTC